MASHPSTKSPVSHPKLQHMIHPQSPPHSPKSPPISPPTSTKSPPRSPTRSPSRLPRLFRRSSKEKKSVEVPVKAAQSLSRREFPSSNGDIDSPVPLSDNTSNISARHPTEAI